MVKRIDLTGKEFGRLLVLGEYLWNKQVGHGSYLCRCACGKELRVVACNLTTGNTTSCGCTMYDRVSGANSPWFTGGKLAAEYRRQRSGAKRRELEFTLTLDEVEAIFGQDCHYCGAAPTPDQRELVRNGIDRMDSSKGYTLSNTVPCCFTCNHIKQDVPYNKFVEQIEKIYTHLKGNKNNG